MTFLISMNLEIDQGVENKFFFVLKFWYLGNYKQLYFVTIDNGPLAFEFFGKSVSVKFVI
jgi:hypothetical protein